MRIIIIKNIAMSRFWFKIARFRRSRLAKIKSKQWKNIAKLCEPIVIMVCVVKMSKMCYCLSISLVKAPCFSLFDLVDKI